MRLSHRDEAWCDLQVVGLRQFGDGEVIGQVFRSFASAMGAGLMMVHAVLVRLFGCFGRPVGGAAIALLIISWPISVPVVIGMLRLMGVVTKNAIMLVDLATQAMWRSHQADALFEAGRKRARTIVMATVAMARNAALGSRLRRGGAFRSPMAIAVIGGLVVSTVPSQIVVSAAFTLLDNGGRLACRLIGRLFNHSDEFEPREPEARCRAGLCEAAPPRRGR